MKSIAYSITILLLGGCASSPMLSYNNDGSSPSLTTLIADKSCDASFQCKVLSIGERPACGGPSQYLIYSNKSLNEDLVEQTAAQVTKQEQMSNKQQTSVDVCKQVLPIQSLCINKKCEAFKTK
ncbi:hypothetical protein PAUR_a3769 [Pseudoalteromonas aurantia 208]|uniref:Lipoprotein n=2 Tax=Pseudoalteromonas aurantia TaxID=43654 RepID=A0ABR9EA83_9GAMM|nr:hypothetical protein [Pseudoalteromonas aurantia 208]